MFYDRGSVEFFYSFGLSPDAYVELMVRFLDDNSMMTREVTYNNVQLQALDSDACGHYCILYGVARSLGDTFHDVVSEMKTLTRDNTIKFIVNTLL